MLVKSVVNIFLFLYISMTEYFNALMEFSVRQKKYTKV